MEGDDAKIERNKEKELQQNAVSKLDVDLIK